MFSYAITMKEDIRLGLGVSTRKFNPMFKRALKDGVLFWHRTFAKRHFLRNAYNEYGDAYTRFKRKNTPYLPMVNTGAFRQRMLRSRSLADVKGTSNGVRMSLAIGRPIKTRGKTLTDRVEAYLQTRPRMEYGDALRIVLDQEMSEQEAFMARWVLRRVKEGENIRKAQRYVYSQVGYSDEMKEAMQEMVTATNDREERRIVQHISEFLGKEMNKPGRSKTRRIGGR